MSVQTAMGDAAVRARAADLATRLAATDPRDEFSRNLLCAELDICRASGKLSAEPTYSERNISNLSAFWNEHFDCARPSGEPANEPKREAPTAQSPPAEVRRKESDAKSDLPAVERGSLAAQPPQIYVLPVIVPTQPTRSRANTRTLQKLKRSVVQVGRLLEKLEGERDAEKVAKSGSPDLAAAQNALRVFGLNTDLGTAPSANPTERPSVRPADWSSSNTSRRP